jgi:DNA-binding HxlR family transcriptional regulator
MQVILYVSLVSCKRVMQRKSFANLQCPIARSLEHVGEWWSMLILRDALNGARRFDAFEKSLRIAPNILTRRLASLVESGLLERRRYSERPPRYEYVPTNRTRDFRPVLWMLLAWGNKHLAPEGESVVVVDAKTGARVDPIVVDRASGRPVMSPDFTLAAGPAASAAIRRVYGAARESSQSAPSAPGVHRKRNGHLTAGAAPAARAEMGRKSEPRS